MQLVEDLVTSYVEGNCLILVALPMSGKLRVRGSRLLESAHVAPR